jgi:hypothetical protein
MLYQPYNSKNKYKLFITQCSLHCNVGDLRYSRGSVQWYARLYGNGCRVIDACGINQIQALRNLNKEISKPRK